MLFKLKILILIFITLLLFSCEKEQTVSSVLIPEIIGLSKVKSWYGDVITIYGKNFGEISDNSSIIFEDKNNTNDTLKWIASDECLKWTNNEIHFTIEEKLETSEIAVCVKGYTSNKMMLKINLTPDFEMIEIKKGEFDRGSEFGLPNEKPVRKVFIPDDFLITKFEVNQELWKSVMKYNPSIQKSGVLPVHNIKWTEAIGFCNELSKKLGFDTTYTIINDSTVIFDIIANGFRLPTEAEWEYSAKAGKDVDFPPDNDIYSVAWFSENSAFLPHKSGMKSPNSWGLYDMQGNVWEWCWDWYDEKYYSTNDTISPKGPAIGQKRVARGGSYKSGKLYIRSTNRTIDLEDFESCGLRVVRSK